MPVRKFYLNLFRKQKAVEQDYLSSINYHGYGAWRSFVKRHFQEIVDAAPIFEEILRAHNSTTVKAIRSIRQVLPGDPLYALLK